MIIKWFLTVSVSIHGLIHLMGGVNETGLAEVEELSARTLFSMPAGMQAIVGAFWFIAVVLFLITAFGLAANQRWWKIAAITAVICSQVLILIWWPAAKWGTIPNILIVSSIYLLSFDTVASEKIKRV